VIFFKGYFSSDIFQRRVIMTDNLFDLNYSDALKEEIRNIKNPKVRKVFMIYFKQMEKDIEEHPEDYILTLGEYLSMRK